MSPRLSGNNFEPTIIWLAKGEGIPNGGHAMRPSPNLRESNPFSEWTISAGDADARIDRAIRICVGNYIREMYREVLNEPIPPRIAKLLRRLDRQGVRPG
jgi:hypothetical protein